MTTISSIPSRIRSIDVLRGAVMVLMAIDHVRVYAGIPSFSVEPGIFFTRWVTHFCVPAFVFVAGTSAYLYSQQLSNKNLFSKFLLTRGLLLVFLELTLIRFCWTFNLNFSTFTLAGVIWMLGWCMVLMSAFSRYSPKAIGVTGLIIVIFQQFFHYLPLLLPEGWRHYFGWFWEFLYPSGLDAPQGITILYVIIPWIGVMMAGYGFGLIISRDAKTRKNYCLWVGCAAIALFLIVGVSVNIFGPTYTGPLPFGFRLLAQQKYPASQLYLLMTLGPVILLIPFAEKMKGWFSDVLTTFGRVPFFYYILHILLIHIAALLTNFLRYGSTHQDGYNTAPYTEIEPNHRWSLGILYLVWFIVEIVLYFICRLYARYKFSHPEMKWLKYI